MSTYFITSPKNISFEAIKEAIRHRVDMEIRTNNGGDPVIVSLDHSDIAGERVNWLHLVVDEKDKTLATCFRNGVSDPYDIIEYLEQAIGCSFISEYEPEYWGVDDFSELVDQE